MHIEVVHGKSPLQRKIRPRELRSISHICAVSSPSVRFGNLEKMKELTDISGAGAHSGGAWSPPWLLLLHECDALDDEEGV